jgi:site-specific recombinase XerD
LRTTPPAERKSPDRWLADFVSRLRRDDLAPATVRGYRYDLQYFLRWFSQAKGSSSRLEKLSILDLINYRQHLVNVEALKPATVNRRLKALRRFCRWAQQNRLLKSNVALELKLVRTTRSTRPMGLTEPEVHSLLRLAGESGHGLATRNYALVQLMVQAGLRVSEVATLRIADITARERSGLVRIREGKGLKAREVPLNATARRALHLYLDSRSGAEESLFLSGRGGAMPTRTIQAVIAHLARRAKIDHVRVSAHTLRHTFALNYLRQSPGKLVELASLLGHESLDTTAIYTRPSSEELAQDLERSRLNVDGRYDHTE